MILIIICFKHKTALSLTLYLADFCGQIAHFYFKGSLLNNKAAEILLYIASYSHQMPAKDQNQQESDAILAYVAED